MEALTSSQLTRLRAVYDALPKDTAGCIDSETLTRLRATLGMESALQAIAPQLSSDATGSIPLGWEAFLALCCSASVRDVVGGATGTQPAKFSRGEAAALFAQLAAESSTGCVTAQRLRRVVAEEVSLALEATGVGDRLVVAECVSITCATARALDGAHAGGCLEALLKELEPMRPGERQDAVITSENTLMKVLRVK